MKNKKFVLLLNFALCGPMALMTAADEPIVKPEPKIESIKLGEFANLSWDAFYKIFDNLPYRTLAKLGRTSSSFHLLALQRAPLRLWTTTKKAQCRPILLQTRQQQIESLSFSPGGHILVAGCGYCTTRFIDVKTGQERMILPGFVSGPRPVFSTIDDNLLASRSSDHGFQLVNLETVQAQQIIDRDRVNLNATDVIFSNNGRLLSFADNDSNIWLASINSNKKAENLRIIKSIKAQNQNSTFPPATKSVAFAPRNKLLAACQEWDTGHLNIYEIDIASGDISKTVHIELPPEAHPGFIEPSFSPDGTKIAFPRKWDHAASCIDQILLWDLINNRKIAEINLPSELDALTFSPDGKMVAAKLHGCKGKMDKKVIVVNADTGELIKELQPPQGVCDSYNSALTFSPRGDLLAVGYGDGLIMLWQVGD